MALKSLITNFYRKILEKASSDRKIKYWRHQGMRIGQDCHLETMAFSTEPFLVEIGDHVAIAYGTSLVTHDGGIWCFRDSLTDGDIFGRIRIGNNVFIGAYCLILPNTVIGNNSIVGAGSVLRGKYPDDSVILGNPAKVFMKMPVQKMLYQQNPGLLPTKNLTDNEKAKIIKKHFCIE
jgi:acetyltransferase-like isoleucine patch superfamily enzyme